MIGKMEIGFFILWLCFGTLWRDVAMEKTIHSTINSFIPFVIKPFDETVGKAGSKDFDLKSGKILTSAIQSTNKDSVEPKSRNKPLNEESKIIKPSIDSHDDLYHDPATCPECQSLLKSMEKDQKASRTKSTKARLPTSDTKNEKDEKPKNPDETAQPKFKQMSILKPFILHKDVVKDAVQKVANILSPKTDNIPESKTSESKQIEQTNSDVLGKVSSVNAANTTPYGTPLNLVKLENEYRMKEYQEILEPICYCANPASSFGNNNNPNCYRYAYPNNGYHNNGYLNNVYTYNANPNWYPTKSGYNSWFPNNQAVSNWSPNNQAVNNWYENNQNVYRKVWRNVVQTTKRNGEVVNQTYYSYPPMFNNNYWTGAGAKPQPIAGYSYYGNQYTGC